MAQQDRMNQILSRDVEKYKDIQESTKSERDRLLTENETLKTECERLKITLAKRRGEPVSASPPCSKQPDFTRGRLSVLFSKLAV